MATAVDKSGNSPATQQPEPHVLTPNEVLSTETTSKIRPGSPSANPGYVPVP